MSDLLKFRAEKDNFFATHPQSPLTSEQRHSFRGLDYFPEDPKLRFKVAVEIFSDEVEIQIQTSTGDVQTYRRFGKFHFTVEGQDVKLTIFANEHGYFLPFVDGLAGTETYPAGRYLDPEPLPNGKFLVDFNLAYNPYCAYNEPRSLSAPLGREPRTWSCPLTPFENRLKVPIRAGEKIPQGDWVDHEVLQGIDEE